MRDSPPPLFDDGDPLAFVPVPTLRARHDGWHPQRQRDFIRVLAATGSVTRAVRAVGSSKQSAYKLRERAHAESFAAAWKVALQMGYDRAFEAAVDQAENGVVVPQFYRGRVIGTYRRHDIRLMIAVLTASMAPGFHREAGE